MLNRLPPTASLSPYHVCFTLSFAIFSIRETMVSAYSTSPLPGGHLRWSPLEMIEFLLLCINQYQTTTALDNGEHCFIIFFSATLRFCEFYTFVALTVRKVSVSGELKMVPSEYTAASHPLMWSAHRCRAPTKSWISVKRTEAIALGHNYASA